MRREALMRRRGLAYYLASGRFVKPLVERVGMETFMKLYDAGM